MSWANPCIGDPCRWGDANDATFGLEWAMVPEYVCERHRIALVPPEMWQNIHDDLKGVVMETSGKPPR